MSMLFIMSIIGIMALNTSSTEIGISGNHKSSQEAFYAADRATEYATVSEDVYKKIGPNKPVNLLDTVNDDETHADRIATPGSTAIGVISYLTRGTLPPGWGSDPTYFEARYYTIDVTGLGPKNTETRIESQVARIVPKS
jgi:type IV pilus assembly protein PilX